MAQPGVDVVHVGSACRDIAPDDPRGWRLGGGVTYAALTTARLGLRTAAVIGVDELAAGAHELDTLRTAGVDPMLVPLADGPVFHNVEAPTGRIQTAIRPGVPLHPVPLPRSWLDARGWSLVPVAAELPDSWVELISPDAIVAVAWQGLLRRLPVGGRVERVPPGPNALVARADLVGVSRHDVDTATPLIELAALLRPGVRLLVTHGERGGLLARTGPTGFTEKLRYLPTHADDELDPTGAGDVFLATLLSTAIKPSILGPRRGIGADLRFAAAAGSLVVEGIGLDGVPDLMRVTVRRARERVRRAVVPTLAAQVGSIESDVGRRGSPAARTPSETTRTPAPDPSTRGR
jgi:sugar/nucleoside kinase (ribokinase family)